MAMLSQEQLAEPALFTIPIPTTEEARGVVEAGVAMPVGGMNVTVQRFGNWYAYAWGVPLVVVLAAACALAFRRGRRVKVG